MKKVFLIENGHGGLVGGVYQTAGKQSPDFGNGILFEGVSNRTIAKKVLALCKKDGINAVELVPENHDISLGERVRRANKYNPANTILVSLHSNAATDEKASGWEIFTSVGKTKSDDIATVIFDEMKKAFPDAKFRTETADGDPDKEIDFFLIKKSACPAVLIENFFMTNKKDCALLQSEKGQDTIAEAIFQAIKRLDK